jgi:transposase
MTAPEISVIVRLNEQTVRRWIRRFKAEGINGLVDKPRPGFPGKVTPGYCRQLLKVVRQRPRALEQDYALWTLVR